MRDIFTLLLSELYEERSAVLATVVSENGKAPKRTGITMLWGKGGKIGGSLGEAELPAEHAAAELLSRGESASLSFSTDAGTIVNVLFEYVNYEDMRWSLLAGAVCDRIAAGKSGWLIRPLSGGLPSLYGEGELLCGEAVPDEELAALCTEQNSVTGSYFASPLPHINRVVIFGGGDIARALVPMLNAVNFSCIVLDNRPEAADRSLFPDAGDVRLCDYNNIDDAVTLTSEDYVIIMTKAHSGDLIVEEQVLRSPYIYLGVVGSRRKLPENNKVLTERGISEETLRTVHCPVGLPIKAATPAEIAVSILGELILFRAELLL